MGPLLQCGPDGPTPATSPKRFHINSAEVIPHAILLLLPASPPMGVDTSPGGVPSQRPMWSADFEAFDAITPNPSRLSGHPGGF